MIVVSNVDKIFDSGFWYLENVDKTFQGIFMAHVGCNYQFSPFHYRLRRSITFIDSLGMENLKGECDFPCISYIKYYLANKLSCHKCVHKRLKSHLCRTERERLHPRHVHATNCTLSKKCAKKFNSNEASFEARNEILLPSVYNLHATRLSLSLHE